MWVKGSGVVVHWDGSLTTSENMVREPSRLGLRVQLRVQRSGFRVRVQCLEFREYQIFWHIRVAGGMSGFQAYWGYRSLEAGENAEQAIHVGLVIVVFDPHPPHAWERESSSELVRASLIQFYHLMY